MVVATNLNVENRSNFSRHTKLDCYKLIAWPGEWAYKTVGMNFSKGKLLSQQYSAC